MIAEVSVTWNEKRNSGGVIAVAPPARFAPPTATITVYVAVDGRLKGDALVWALEQVSDMRVIAASGSDRTALANANSGVLLVDAEAHDSVHAAAALHAVQPDARIVVTNLDAANDEVRNFVKAGVLGFVLKDASRDEFAGTIRAVANGETVLPAGLTHALFSRTHGPVGASLKSSVERRVDFTKREHQVLDLVYAGMSNRDIGQRLNMSAHTVKCHVRSVLKKVALHSRLQLAAWVSKHHGPADS
jgi:DNA-binding NarL/FixJ family response regulator